ncbi:MAG TPA: hypothetical protein H9761_19315 [Candidatus Eisenbergiella merdavium]|uniref:DNA topology modulation protein FlaR n=1 Tax=Candidatus Eisenbergiella merdavium TaxID=2838551 RepID=A0A9D2SR92_9FIRM|nr:hypothetical protein [Candidatus Eisenbergiella merdavium]
MKYQGKTYDRVMLVGGSGSGKSWTAERLGRLTGMPVIYLDKECWQPGWKYPPKEEWEAKNREFIAKEEWIIDGNHRETLEMRLQRAQLLLFFDINPLLCIWRVWWRHGCKRPDLSEELEEKRNLDFYRLLGFIWTSYRKRREHILSLHEKYPVMMLQFKRTGQVKRFLADVEKENRKSG